MYRQFTSRFGMDLFEDGILRGALGANSDLLGDFSLKLRPGHVEGCACAGCSAHDDGKNFQPGGDISSSVDSIPGSTSTTATLSVGGFQTSAIDTGTDSDWFRITLTAGETYTFSTYLGGGGLSDSILTLRNASGATLVVNDDANTSAGLYWSEITYTATSSGTYYLDVTSYGGATGNYYVTASRPLDDSVGHTSGTSGTLTIGASPTDGQLEDTGDHDWYAVTLQAGETYEFTTYATGGSSDVDTTLTLRDSSGNVLAYNDDRSGTYSQVRFVAETSGTYYIDVGGWAESQAGAYRVEAAIAEPLTEFTNDQIADQLLYGYWGGASAGRHFDVAPGGTITVNVTRLTADGQFLAREALGLWSDALGISFSEVTSGGQIVFDDEESGAYATSTRSGNIITVSNINISTDWLASSGTTLNSYSFQTYLHEIGHALGLGHGGNYNSSADYLQDASYLNDSWATTVMSYFSQNENSFFSGQGFSRVFAVSPRAADILAVQEAYGVATTTRVGDNIYGVGNDTGREIFGVGTSATNSQGHLLAFTIVDHGGNDTLNYSSFSQAQIINLNTETFSSVGGSIGNMSIARGTVIENAVGGSGADQLFGNAVANQLTGGLGNDTIDGGANIDIAIVSGNRAAYTISQTSTGVFRVVGPDGTDTLTGIEYLQFADQTMRLLPGSGVAVNFNTANPADYQAAMNAIRDFDGNALGGNGNWLRIGSADVDGDGDIDQILVNDAIGRFATVGGYEDGLFYFDDYSWAGETRIAGIYIDPLVASGDVVAGGPDDSQRRFQNDLQIENINRVLGADDYDGDGLQEVYFGLTDGTAYLHAYMHADGNIRYANYQSEQQVIDYLTANGYSSSTWDGWFSSGAEEETKEPAGALSPLDELSGAVFEGGLGAGIGGGLAQPTPAELSWLYTPEVFA